ncbi:MAG: CDP-glycerol glycerophosphotransferase family protein, partial [Microbacteriaceae bacterium]
MGRFTFAAGNLRKIATLPLYALGAAAATVTSRREDLWVFGSGTGLGEGALALARHLRAAEPDVRVVWLARDARDIADARALGLPVALRSSWRGFRLTLRARVAVVTHGFGDVNRFGLRGAFVVNLWHGIPFKRIRMDSPEAMRLPVLGRLPGATALVRRMYGRSGRGIALFATASELSAARIRTAFALDARRAVVTGDPRDDVLCALEPAARERAARERVAAATGDARMLNARLVLFAPTWRDGRAQPGVPGEQDWRAIDRVLADAGAMLLVRSHPLGHGDFTAGPALSDRVTLLGPELIADVTPVLPAIDTLVTDYSSIAYDFALVGGPVLFLAPDAADYARRRGVYEPYRVLTGGEEATSWPALLPRLAAALAPGEPREAMCQLHAVAT